MDNNNTQSPRWSLQDLAVGDPQILDQSLTHLASLVAEFETLRPHLDAGMQVNEFLDILHRLEHIYELSAQLGAYAYLHYTGNTQNSAALSLRARIEDNLTDVDNRLLFFNLWFKELTDEAAAPFIASAGKLSYYLQSARRFKPYTLSEAEEKVINIKDLNGCQALVRLYEIITSGFTFHIQVNGEEKELTKDGIAQHYSHPSPDVRAAAYQELYRVYGGQREALAQIYFSIVRDYQAELIQMRKYASPISVRNLLNHIPDAVVATLLDVCRQNVGLYQRYYRLKARMLGVERLRRCDIYAPLAKTEKAIDFASAMPLVLDCFSRFSPEIAQTASRVLDSNHLDAQVRPGKRGGAFCYSVTPQITPWVHINYTGRIRDVTTLAHELGHAVHSMLAKDHSVLTFHAPLPLAETASVFAEMLVTDRLLKDETDPAVQTDMLVTILDNAYATVQRQAYLSIFEREAHAKIAAGATSEELAAAYMENLIEQFGDSLEMDDQFAWEWLVVPHIFSSPFYTYAYAFGQLLVLALYQRYVEEGDAFVPGYLKLLSYGGSAEPQTVLADAGLDVASSEFWQGGFDALQTHLTHLEDIVGGPQ